MKNKLVLVGLAIVATTMFSCKKDYNCKCSKTYNNVLGTQTYDDGNYVYKDNRVKAEDRCNKEESTGSDIMGDYTRTCDIQ